MDNTYYKYTSDWFKEQIRKFTFDKAKNIYISSLLNRAILIEIELPDYINENYIYDIEDHLNNLCIEADIYVSVREWNKDKEYIILKRKDYI